MSTEISPGLVPFHELDLGFGHSITLMTREDWGAAPPESQAARLKLPVTRVRFTYTGFDSCSSARECVQMVQALQKFHKKLGRNDLAYNFIIGGDLRVYEAGGWVSDTEKQPKHSQFRAKTISIAYLGNYRENDPPYEMMWSAMNVVKYGLKEKLISTLFKII